MTVMGVGMWRDRRAMRANAMNTGWLIKRGCLCCLGAHGSVLGQVSHMGEPQPLPSPRLVKTECVSPVKMRTWSAQRARGLPCG